MEFVDIHLDGFGTFENRDVGPLRAGLNVIVGENEAGKSTLLDFIRGILYGFSDRRSPRSFHEPILGGRHGGSITVRDAHGSIWTIERHVGGTVSLNDASGAPVSQSELSNLLGHTDRKVFESIFAFGLDELAEAERLHDDSVRDLIFSAGVAGAGRSASQAIRRIEEQRSEITKSSRAQGATNQLQSLIKARDEAIEQLRSMRARTNAFIRLQHEIRELDQLATQMFATLSETERRGKELDDLADAERSRQRRLGLERELALLHAPTASEVRLVEERPRIGALSIRLESFAREVGERERLSQEMSARRERILLLRDRIGLRPEQSTPRTITIGVENEIEALEREYQRVQLDLHARTEAHAKAAEALERQQLVVTMLADANDPGEVADVETQLKELATLRSMLASRREAALEHQLARRDHRGSRSPSSGVDRTVIAILVLIALCGLAAVVAHLTRPGNASVPVALLGLAVTLASLGGLALLAMQRHRSSTANPTDSEDRGLVADRELAERVSDRARRLALPDQPTEAELEELEVKLRDRERLAGEIKLATVGEQQCANELHRATEELHAVEALQAELRTRAAQFGSALGLEHRVEPGALTKIVATIADLVEQERQLKQESERLRELQGFVDAYEREFASLCRAIERTVTERAGYASMLVELDEAAERAETRINARASVVTEIGLIDEILNSLTNRGGDGDRLRDELEHGSPAERELERATLAVELKAITEGIEQTVGRRRDVQNELDSLLRSSSIAELEIRCSTLEIEISEIFERWAVLTLSGLLLKEALSRYEIERQPEVIARAGRLFSEVTEGRYVTLSSHEDDQQRRSLRVTGRDGRGFDAQHLSKGAAEQLYLCVRLAYAMTFAERAVAMPLIFDDVLVNFDPQRCRQMAQAITAVAKQHQVILFTCHPEIVQILSDSSPHANVVTLNRIT